MLGGRWGFLMRPVAGLLMGREARNALLQAAAAFEQLAVLLEQFRAGTLAPETAAVQHPGQDPSPQPPGSSPVDAQVRDSHLTLTLSPRKCGRRGNAAAIVAPMGSSCSGGIIPTGETGESFRTAALWTPACKPGKWLGAYFTTACAAAPWVPASAGMTGTVLRDRFFTRSFAGMTDVRQRTRTAAASPSSGTSARRHGRLCGQKIQKAGFGSRALLRPFRCVIATFAETSQSE